MIKIKIDVHHHKHRHRRRPRIKFNIGPVTEQSVPIIKRGTLMFALKDTQKVRLAINPQDAKGNAAVVDGVPQWSSSDESVAMVNPEADGLSATVIAVGPLGLVQINVSADADTGEGIEELTGTLDVQVVGGKAVSLGIAAGVAEEQ